MAKTWPSYTPSQLLDAQLNKHQPWHENYYVMFSTAWGGFSTNPSVWGVPPDDHMTHRGDAIFESFKCVGGRAYCFKEHLERLANSAAALGLEIPLPPDEILDILKQAYRLGGHEDFVVRLTVSRGPGSFSINPYDSVGGSQLYLVTLKLKQPSPETYESGVKLGTAPFPAKTEYSSIKSCDYLHNVLAKKAALDAGANYVVSFDEEGYMTEGATESVGLITKSGDLCVPSFSRILKGVTLARVLELAQKLVSLGKLNKVENRDFTESEAKSQAAEVFLATTSFDVLGVSHWDGQPVGPGRAGPITKELRALIDSDIRDHASPFLTDLS
ncbi:MAG: aminotransferase class IV [Deltaproteobacteria bacterium]|jgi:branched-chain amino acid aminotransferase|nr:aminotransferase class IV [Deltaproteobacteria bacterium]